MNIVFWSPYHGVGTSACMLAFAGILANEYDMELVLMQTHFSMNRLSRALLGRQGDKECLKGAGIDELVRFFKSAEPDADKIGKYLIRAGRRIRILPGTNIKNRELYEGRVTRAITLRAVELFNKMSDCVLIDANAGECITSKDALDIADVVVVVVRQSPCDIMELSGSDCLTGKKLFYVLSGYDPQSRYSIKNLRAIVKNFNTKNVVGLSYCTDFFDAMEEGRVADFFEQEEGKVGIGRVAEFRSEVRLCVKALLDFVKG